MKVVAGFAFLLLAAGSAWGDTYTIDPNHTLPVFEVGHLGFSTQRGRFEQTAGTIHLDWEKRTGSVTWTIQADSIDMGQAKWNEHLKSPDFFNVASFPTITYRAERLQFQGDTPVSAEGELTLLGVARPVKVSILRFTCGTHPINHKELCAADIEATLKRSEFGMSKYLPGVSDAVRVLVPVEAYKD
ncbi:YceI family protein [Methyloterricola oryzae]|uniref:YceI family protein n=1 Tax=Methyloterricola oryzae TaxID=1495050 RepID=UPI0005EB3E2D|nr:YceI family protein [Methyloterricola oryzae]